MKYVFILLMYILSWGQSVPKYDTVATQYNLEIYRINEGYTINVDDTVNEGDEVHLIFSTGGTLPPYESPYTRYWWKREIFINTPDMWEDTTAHIYFTIDYPTGEYELVVNALAISEDTLFGYGTNAVYIRVDTSDVPLMIDMSFFEAVMINSSVSITWVTESELNNCGYNLYKKERNGLEVKITELPIPGEVNSAHRAMYGLIDHDVSPGKSYTYTLESVSCSGEREIEGRVSVYVPIIPGIFLAQNYPNPFNNSTTIEYSIDERAEVSMALIDIKGSKIARVFKEIKEAGVYTQTINVNNIASGTYLYALRIHNMRTMSVQILTKKMVVIK